MCHVLDSGVTHAGFCCGNQKGIDHLENLGVDEKIILKFILNKFNGKAWNGSGLIIIIIIIIIINCNWVVTRLQWLFYIYTKYEIGYY